MLDFAASFPADTVVAGPEVNAAHANAALRLQVLAGGKPRNLILRAPAGGWDVSDHLYLAAALRNTGPACAWPPATARAGRSSASMGSTLRRTPP